VPDLAVGAWGDDGDDGARPNAGAVYVLFLRRDGSAKPAAAGSGGALAYRKLASPAGAQPGGQFGAALALLRADGAGSVELAVGSPAGGALGGGEVHLLALRPGGVLARTRQLAPAGLGRPTDRFGASLTALEGVGAAGGPALAVGAPGARASDEGALLDLSSDVDGAVHVVDVGGGEGGAGGGTLLATIASPAPLRGALFGYAIAGAPDYDGNGVADLVVGAPASAGGGALYVLFLARNASQAGALHTMGHRRVGAAELDLEQDAGLGRSLARLGRVDADLVEDLGAGIHYDAPDHENGGQLVESAGGALVLLLNAYTYPHPPPTPPPSAPLPPAPPLDTWEVRMLDEHTRPVSPLYLPRISPYISPASPQVRMLDEHNSRRAAHCAPPLVWDAALAESAMAHAASCPAADEPSAAGREGKVGESVAVGPFHTTAKVGAKPSPSPNPNP